MKVLTVVGTRPNLIKITQFHKEAQKHSDIEHKLIHTGQHYSHNMNDVFFDELELPLPDYSLDVDKSSVVKQIAGIMVGLEEKIKEYNPDVLIVVGDVNSTLAAALVGNKLGIFLIHLESGLRSNDGTMPEEHNRVLTDKITDLYFVTEQSGYDNLVKEGVDESKIKFVGNTMIDTLVAFDEKIKASRVVSNVMIEPKSYALMTMHRPGNVDGKAGLQQLLDVVNAITAHYTIVFPIHPRTQKMFEEFGLYKELESNGNLILLDPIGYIDFQNLIYNSLLVITDSGGIQEETTFRKIPCITLRPNTERPSTIDTGSNTLLDFDVDKIMEVVTQIKDNTYKNCEVPPLWDGKSTERIFKILSELNI